MSKLPEYPHEFVKTYNSDTGAEPEDESPGAHALYRAGHWALRAERRNYEPEKRAGESALAQAWATIAAAHFTRESSG